MLGTVRLPNVPLRRWVNKKEDNIEMKIFLFLVSLLPDRHLPGSQCHIVCYMIYTWSTFGFKCFSLLMKISVLHRITSACNVNN